MIYLFSWEISRIDIKKGSLFLTMFMGIGELLLLLLLPDNLRFGTDFIGVLLSDGLFSWSVSMLVMVFIGDGLVLLIGYILLWLLLLWDTSLLFWPISVDGFSSFPYFSIMFPYFSTIFPVYSFDDFPSDSFPFYSFPSSSQLSNMKSTLPNMLMR